MADVFRLCTNRFRFSNEFLLADSTGSSKQNPNTVNISPALIANKRGVCIGSDSGGGFGEFGLIPRKQFASFKVHAAIAETDQPKWWEKNAGPNMIDIHSTQEFLGALSQTGDRLVIVEFYGTWCASCRALFPKLCKTAQEHSEILFLKVNFDENKQMCKSLNVRVLPYFHFYRGADGLVESFSCSLAKFQKIKYAIEKHNKARDGISHPGGVGGLSLEATSVFKNNPSGSSSS